MSAPPPATPRRPSRKVRHFSHLREIPLERGERTVLESRCALEAAAEVVNGFEDVAVVDFARARLVPTGNVADVEVADAIDVRSDVLDQVPFHDLHVIDVEEELDVRAAHA